MKVFFSSDFHFNHSNILRYSNRPFKNVVEMNEAIIERWNKKVGKQDLAYFLGDFVFGRNDMEFDMFFQRLNGLIVLVSGNHDKLTWRNRHKFYSAHKGYHEIKINDQDITLNHYAQVTWNKKHHSAWCLCGHSHYGMAGVRKEGKVLGKILDVGVDGNSFEPYSFEEIKTIMDAKPINCSIPELNDHHTNPN